MVEKNEEYSRWPSLFDPLYDPLRSFGRRVAEWLNPASAASGNDDAYTISVELPGVAESDVDLSVHDGSLVIRGEKKTETTQQGETWYFSERQYGAFSRSFRLPEDADSAKAHAAMKDGVLTVSIPRIVKKAQNQPQKISIAKG
jgi:HSP20 family protein